MPRSRPPSLRPGARQPVSGQAAGRRGKLAARLAAAGAAAAAGLLGFAGPALAQPATTASYASGASASLYTGQAFDTCAAPPPTTMTAWAASPYRAIGVYIGGINRSCAQPELTAAWVTAVSGMGWRLLPVYKGLQAPCGGKPTDQKIDPAQATAEGTAAASDAVTQAKTLGLLGGSAIYNDMEYYQPGIESCRIAVLQYLSGWTAQLHKLGYVAGVYAQLASGAADLAGVYMSGSYARPDALWIARYDGNPSLTGLAGIPDADWAAHQRAKQYRGGHDETYGGITLSIDNDQVDAPVATVAYHYAVTSSTPLNARSGPAASYRVVKTYPPASDLTVVCQAAGGKVGTTSIWDKLTDGTYVTDYYVSTPSNTGYSAPLPRCSYPYQVTAAGGLHQRTGPGISYRSGPILPNGALAWVTCQAAGGKVGSTRIWDKLTNGLWVTDAHVATQSNNYYSRPAPRC